MRSKRNYKIVGEKARKRVVNKYTDKRVDSNSFTDSIVKAREDEIALMDSFLSENAITICDEVKNKNSVVVGLKGTRKATLKAPMWLNMIANEKIHIDKYNKLDKESILNSIT